MYLSGLRTGGLVHFNGTTLAKSAELPAGTHNAQPFRNGVLNLSMDVRTSLATAGSYR